MGKVVPGLGYQEPVHLTIGFGQKQRKITAVIGAEYEVEPLNAQKKQHRGRR